MSEVEEIFDLNSVEIDNAYIFKEELKYNFSEDQLKDLCIKDYLKVLPYKTNALTVLEKKLKRDGKFKFNRILRLQLKKYLDIDKNNDRLIKYYNSSFIKFQSTKQKRWEQRKINSLFSLGILHLASYESGELNSLEYISSPNRKVLLSRISENNSNEIYINTEEFLPGTKQNFTIQENKENMNCEEISDENTMNNGTESFLPGAKQNYTTNLNIDCTEKQSQTYLEFQPISVSTQNSNPYI